MIYLAKNNLICRPISCNYGVYSLMLVKKLIRPKMWVNFSIPKQLKLALKLVSLA